MTGAAGAHLGRPAREGGLAQLRSAAAASSFYSLTEHGRARFAEATQRIYGAPRRLGRRWTLVIFPPTLRARRERLARRAALARLRPDHAAACSRTPRIESRRSRAAARRAASRPARSSCMQRASRDAGGETERWSRRAGTWASWRAAIERFMRDVRAGARRRCSARSAGRRRDGFVLRTLLIHEYRKIHLRDPLLPAPLLPRRLGRHRRARNSAAICTRKCFAASEQYLSRDGADAGRRLAGAGRGDFRALRRVCPRRAASARRVA